ncbi:hypothetical protein BGZ47_011361 [Haplosporangium gracile]|nr:hypothetical protein BGZ47_011361 [Haplosporangium gracile]
MFPSTYTITSRFHPQVGEYLLGRVIGHGGFSVVREATSIQMDESGQVDRVAVKIVKIQTGATDNDRVQKMLRKEIAIWSQISHPHVLPFLAVEELPMDTFIFCELCTGGQLLNYLSLRSDSLSQSTTPTTPRSAKPLEEDEARVIFNQVAEAVRYLHEEKRIVHRDIKLENILRHEDGTWKICDFGLAEYQDEEAAACFGESLMSSTGSGSTLLASPNRYEDPVECSAEVRDLLKNMFRPKPEDRWPGAISSNRQR